MTRTSLLKTATLSLLIGAMTIPSIASAAAPQSRGTEYNHRSDRDDRRDVRDDRRDDRFERRGERRDDRREVRRTGYKYGYGAFHAPFRAQTFRAGDRISRTMTSSRFIINNPRTIGLPYAGRKKAYVRHYNDVLLVNVRSGKVVAVYRNHLRW